MCFGDGYLCMWYEVSMEILMLMRLRRWCVDVGACTSEVYTCIDGQTCVCISTSSKGLTHIDFLRFPPYYHSYLYSVHSHSILILFLPLANILGENRAASQCDTDERINNAHHTATSYVAFITYHPLFRITFYALTQRTSIYGDLTSRLVTLPTTGVSARPVTRNTASKR